MAFSQPGYTDCYGDKGKNGYLLVSWEALGLPFMKFLLANQESEIIPCDLPRLASPERHS